MNTMVGITPQSHFRADIAAGVQFLLTDAELIGVKLNLVLALT